MKKISVGISNDFCPQTLFLYGTNQEDGTPDFGLFCWFSYTWMGDALGAMACIGGEKLTKDRIRATGIFSANLVTEPMLPLADYYGTKSGYSADKMKDPPEILHGAVLDVPILAQSPWAFELEVAQEIKLDGSDVFLCRIRNVLADEPLLNSAEGIAQRLRRAAPVTTTCQTYFSFDGRALGAWGEPQKALGR